VSQSSARHFLAAGSRQGAPTGRSVAVLPLLLALLLLATATPTDGLAQAGPLCPSCFSVAVTPDGAPESHYINTSGLLVTFTVVNTGSLSASFTFTCSTTGGLTCGTVTPGSATIAAGATKEVDVTYSVGGSGGTLTLTATGPATDAGSYLITALTPPTVTLQVPTLTSGSRAVVRNRTPIIRAILTRGSLALDTTKTALLWKTDTVTKWRADSLTVARANRGLIEWEVDSIAGLNGAGADSALITARACDTGGQCTIVTRYAVLPHDSTAALSWLGTPRVASNSIFSAPFGPGIAVSGGEVETGFSTIPYFSMGSARSAGLVYSTRQSYPRVLVPVHLELRGSTTPDQMVVRLFDGATKIDSLKVALPTCSTGSAARCRVVLQGDFSGSSFGTPTRKWLKVEVEVTKGAVVKTSIDSIEAVLVDRRSTMYGSGWWPSALLKLVVAGSDRVLVSPTGTATIYRGNGDSLYLPPVGSFVGLTKTASGWELRARGDSAVVRFDSYGRIRAAQDRNGNLDSLVYGGGTGLDTLKQLRDPVGKTMTFAYNSAGKLTSITDANSRVTKDSIDASNRLIYDSLPSPTGAPFTTRYTWQSYPGTNTVVLATRLGVLTDTTILVYDSKARPVQVMLPVVKDTLGASVKPVISYTAVESRGYGALVRTDSAGPYVQLKDPLNNWTRSWLNRMGQAVLSWDTLGVLGRSRAAPDGRVLWTSGKIGGDTTKTYVGYDSQQRMVKQWIRRVETNDSVLRLDSLVYNANHRVIQRIDSRGQKDSMIYDGKGNVTQARDAGGYSTRYWYKPDGRVDSILRPSTSVKTWFKYETTWKQVAATMMGPTASPTLIDSTTYDSYGRASAAYQKVRVRIATGVTKWQWRKSIPYYRITNQADSTVMSRTDECNDPCWTPPAFGTDAAHTQKVGLRFDRGGRDSLRLVSNDTAKATRYLYDRLGRLLSRRPPSSLATPPRDSMVYDIAGNLLKTITRRGDIISAQYDSRNRTMATVIPGVGTLNSVFGGPLDQLTRLYYSGAVDSIGGVNGEVRTGYDRRGRLLADTSYTGATARSTTHSYDQFERDSASTGPTGTWIIRYDAQRGLPSRLVTPFADSTNFSFDGQARLSSSNAISSGPTQTRDGSFTSTGIALLEHSVASVGGTWYAGVYDPEGNADGPAETRVALGPVWTEQHGLTAAMDSTVDSLKYDGWERLLSWRSSRKTPPATTWTLTTDSVSFDVDGNVLTPGGAESYEAKTGRLLSRTDPVTGSWTYSYDAAGNQSQAVRVQWGSTYTWKYLYDALNRLTSVRIQMPGWAADSLVARYGYDVLGRRIVKRVYRKPQGGVLGYLRMSYAGDAVAFETDSTGASITLAYTWGTDVDDLIGVRDVTTGIDYQVVQDQLHSVRGLVRRDGAWALNQRFLPSGQLLSQEVGGVALPALRYGWTGREYDAETGFSFHRARFYDPGQRRWTQEDPIGYDGSANLYAYVSGRVLDSRDPSGMIESGGRRQIVEQEMFGGEDPFASGLDGLPLPDGGRAERRAERAKKKAEEANNGAQQGVPNVATGDPILDNPGSRAVMERAAAGAVPSKEYPGYMNEVAGQCYNVGPCTGGRSDDIGSAAPGNQDLTRDLAFNYHTHGNTGMINPRDPSGDFVDGPSNADIRLAAHPSRGGAPSYILTPSSIYRLSPATPAGNTFGPSSVCYQRWAGSTSGCRG